MDLVLYNHVIDADVETILQDIYKGTGGKYLKSIRRKGDNIQITCPFHKDGQENHPSCFVYARRDNESVQYGFYKCFTCAEQGPLYKLVAKCFDCSYEDAKQWLIDNYSSVLQEQTIDLGEITLDKPQKMQYMDESFLDQYAYFHPYMFQRKLTEEVIRRFKIGWNPDTDAITFPIWDEWGRLIGISERKVQYKQFNLPKDMPKVVYLLDEIIEKGITEVYVVESQIDALYLWSVGKPAVALFGTGSKEQYKILNKSGVRIYHLALDGDVAGRHGNLRLIRNLPNTCMIDVCLIPDGKDINDLSAEEIDNLEKVSALEYLQMT